MHGAQLLGHHIAITDNGLRGGSEQEVGDVALRCLRRARLRSQIVHLGDDTARVEERRQRGLQEVHQEGRDLLGVEGVEQGVLGVRQFGQLDHLEKKANLSSEIAAFFFSTSLWKTKSELGK